MKNLIFTTLLPIICLAGGGLAAPVHLVDESPVSIKPLGPDSVLVDFGRVAFGNIQLLPPTNADHPVTLHFGEDLVDGRVNRQPKGTVRYAVAKTHLGGTSPLIAAPPVDARNTQNDFPNTPPAIRTPEEWGVVLPFRWVEIEGWPGTPDARKWSGNPPSPALGTMGPPHSNPPTPCLTVFGTCAVTRSRRPPSPVCMSMVIASGFPTRRTPI